MRFYDRTIKSRGGIVAGCAASVAALALSGCMGSPTYGTDKTANEQLVGDMTNIFQIAPKQRPKIDYNPRPALVRPVKGANEALPAPQDSVASIDNPAWVESPERKRARLRADADENSDDPSWTPQIDQDMGRAQARPGEKRVTMNDRNLESGIAPVGFDRQKAQNDAFRKKRAETRQGSSTTRKYLSEPPVDYRQVAESAPVGDIGEDEVKKERRLKAAAAKKNDSKWVNLWPF